MNKQIKKEDYIGKIITWEQAVELFPSLWLAFEEPQYIGATLVKGKLKDVLTDEEVTEYRLEHWGTGIRLKRTCCDMCGGYINGILVDKRTR